MIFSVYVGPYFDWPNNISELDEFLESHQISDDDNFLPFFVNNRTGDDDFMSDKIVANKRLSYEINFSGEDENAYNLDDDFIKKSKASFAYQTEKLRTILKQYHGVNPEIKFGVLRYDE